MVFGGLALMINMSGIVAFTSGVLSFFSPCILPLIPSYLVFISNISLDNYNEPALKKYRKIVSIHALSFILGFSFVFVSLGLTTTLISKFFFMYQTYIIRAGGLILILMGLFSLNIIKIPFLNIEKVIHLKEKPLGLFGSFLVGISFSLGWTPCVGPALSSILIIAATSQEITEGLYLLSLYSLGLAIPFFISALLFDRLFDLLKRFHTVARYSMKFLGVLLIIIGVLLLTNYYNILSLKLMGAFPI